MSPPRRTGPTPDAVSMALISMIMALTALGVDLLLPAFDDVRAAFGLDEDSTRPALLITVYFLGLAVAQLAWGPLSDRFGRRPILYSALAVYGLGTLGAALAGSFEALLASRALWGVGAAGTRVVAIAIIRDLHEGDRMAAYMSRVMAIFLIVPVIAPLLGAGVLAVAPWRWLFWLTLLATGLLGLWALRMPETLDPGDVLPLRWRTVGQAAARTFTTPVTLAYAMATVFMQGAFASYLASSELVLDTAFGRGDQFPVVFGVVAAALGVASLVASRLVTRIGGVRMVNGGFAAATALSALLLVIALAGDGTPRFWVFYPLLTLQLCLYVALMPTLSSLALMPMGDIAGTATSVTGALRTLGGAVLGAVVDRFVGGTVTPWAIAMVAGSVASLVVVRAVRPPPTAMQTGEAGGGRSTTG